MKKKLLAIVAGTGIVALAAGVAYAQLGSHGHGSGMNPERARRFVSYKVNEVMDEISATPAQRAQANAIKDRLLAEATQMHARGRQAHQEMFGQLKSGPVNAARVHQLINEQADAHKAFATKVADELIAFQQSLTSEQRTRLAAELEQHHGRW